MSGPEQYKLSDIAWSEVNELVTRDAVFAGSSLQIWSDGLPVYPSGITPEGQRFESITGLRKLLSQQPEKLAWGVTTHLLTYATGEASSPLDRKAIQQIIDSAKPNDYGLRSLVHGLVQSETFRSK